MFIVESSLGVLDDALVFGDTRVPIRNLFDYLAAGDTVKDFLEDFPTVSFEQVRHLLHNSLKKG